MTLYFSGETCSASSVLVATPPGGINYLFRCFICFNVRLINAASTTSAATESGARRPAADDSDDSDESGLVFSTPANTSSAIYFRRRPRESPLPARRRPCPREMNTRAAVLLQVLPRATRYDWSHYCLEFMILADEFGILKNCGRTRTAAVPLANSNLRLFLSCSLIKAQIDPGRFLLFLFFGHFQNERPRRPP